MSIAEKKEKIRILFMGTPEFSVPCLKALINEIDFDIVGVYTQSDKPVGRKQEMLATPIKRIALENGLAVFQPAKIKPETENIRSLNPDLIVVVAYGKIIPPEILEIPKYGCINVHASLLPKYRGAACLSAPILNGDKETGVTIMKMEAGLDTGPIIRQEKIELSGEETWSDIHDKLSELGSSIIADTLKDWISGKARATAQDDEAASYIGLTKKEDGKIDFNRRAEEIERMVRAYNIWPGAHCIYNGYTMKILKAKIAKNTNKRANIGEAYLDEEGLAVQCGQNSLLILELQLPGKKVMKAKEFLNGNKEIIGAVLE